MNLTESKNVRIVDFLHVDGHMPIKTMYGSAWFLSPLRQETNPSFKVDLFKNMWYDFGIGEGGNLIGLVMKIYKVDLSESLSLISKISYSPEQNTPVSSDKSDHIKINRVQPLTNFALTRYLNSRGVSLSFAQRFLKEAYYTVHDRNYFALAFKNDRGGYELRNAAFKTGSSPKYLTTIPGIDNSKINVFEGFMDFLSCCTLHNRSPKFMTIILNSLSFLPKIESVLVNAKEVNLYLDNDLAGRTATQKIISCCGIVKDWAPVKYPDHKDFNDFLMKKNPIE